MARERMVTRTVCEAKVEAMVANIAEQKLETRIYSISATVKEGDEVKFISKFIEKDSNIKVVSILNRTETEVLYGMPEVDFIRLAKVLPPRTANTDE